MPNRPRKGQSGKVSSKAGTARNSKMKKRRKRKFKKKHMELQWAEDEKLEEIKEGLNDTYRRRSSKKYLS